MADSIISGVDLSAPKDVTTHELVHDTIVRWLREEASLSVDQVDYDAPLFELGIDSLGAATIGNHLERQTGKVLNPEVLYELETINELAAHLDSLRGFETARGSDSDLYGLYSRSQRIGCREDPAGRQRRTHETLRAVESPRAEAERRGTLLL